MRCRVLDLDLSFEAYGAGRAILMLHGLPLDHRHIERDMEPLFVERPGWRRLYLDLPGMGKTPGPDWISNQDQVLDVVCAFLDAVAPGERCVVAGISYGGYLARGLVYRRGVLLDGMMVAVPVVESDSAKRVLPQPLVVHPDPAFLADLTSDEQDLRELVVAQNLDLLAAMRRDFVPAGAIADHALLQRLRNQYAFSFPVDTLPAPFPAPALFLTGRQDIWCGYHDAYQLLDQYPRASYAVLDRAGHVLALEQTALFRALVGEWLDRVEEYTRTTQTSA